MFSKEEIKVLLRGRSLVKKRQKVNMLGVDCYLVSRVKMQVNMVGESIGQLDGRVV